MRPSGRFFDFDASQHHKTRYGIISAQPKHINLLEVIMQKDEKTKAAQEDKNDPIVTLGEKHFPGWFSTKDKSSLIWSSAAVIFGGIMVAIWAFSPLSQTQESPKKVEAGIEIAVTESPDSWPSIFEEKKDQIKVVKGFTTGIAGVVGWIIEDKNGGPSTQSLMYTANDGELAIVGGIIGKNNTNITLQQFEEFASSEAVRMKDAAKAKAAQQAAQQAAPKESNLPKQKSEIDLTAVQSILSSQPVVTFGEGDKKLVILVDLNCPYCHQYYFSIISDPELLKMVQIDFMPVGILSMDSIQKAAMFDGLSQEDAQGLFRKLMTNQESSINPSEQSITASMARSQKWNEAGLNVVPMTIINFDEPANSKALAGIQNNASLKGASL